MKKAHITNLIIILFMYVFAYVLNIILKSYDVNIFFTVNLENYVKLIIALVNYLVLLVPTVIYSAVVIFNKFIAHKRKVKLHLSRYLLIITSLIISYLFLLFDVAYYFYFGSIILLYIIYFVSLYVQDHFFIQKQQSPTVKVNQEVVEKFLELLGGKDNVININYEQSRLRVEFKDVKKLKLDELKNLGAKGAFVAGNKLQAVIGSNASELENAINAYLSRLN